MTKFGQSDKIALNIDNRTGTEVELQFGEKRVSHMERAEQPCSLQADYRLTDCLLKFVQGCD